MAIHNGDVERQAPLRHLIHPNLGKWLACPRKLCRIKLLNETRQQPPEHAMGETLQPFTTRFNKSLRVESRAERLTGDAGVVALREIMERSGIVEWMTPQLTDPRRQEDVVHDLASLIRTSVLLAAQGWRDHDDADALRDDPAFRLAISSASGRTPLDGPHGLASQPTLSRFTAIMSEPSNMKVLREGALELAARGLRAANSGRRLPRVTLDVDSIPIEVHSHQPKAEWNGHYNARIYHPLVTSIASRRRRASGTTTCDMLDARLRPGNVGTAEGRARRHPRR